MIDVDGDADLDLIVGFENAEVRLYTQDDDQETTCGKWFCSSTIGEVGAGRGLAVVDSSRWTCGCDTPDECTTDDVVLVVTNGGSAFAFAYSDADEGFTTFEGVTPPACASPGTALGPLGTSGARSPRVAAVDYDGDDDHDVIHGHDNRIYFLRQTPDGWTAEVGDDSEEFVDAPGFNSFAVGDLDEDGLVDVVVTQGTQDSSQPPTPGPQIGITVWWNRPEAPAPTLAPTAPHQFKTNQELLAAAKVYTAGSQEFGPIEDWDVSLITDMSKLFCTDGCPSINSGAASFNADISKWDTGKVMFMDYMFQGAEVFNADISKWDTGSATTMNSMFTRAAAFDANIGGWVTAKVVFMDYIFQGAEVFNADISSWDTGRVTTMQSLFRGAAAFDANIGGWNTASVTTMNAMFAGASAFNQDLSEWVVPSSTEGIASLFAGATAFNQELGWCFAFAQPAGFAGDSGCVDEASGLADDCGVAFCPPSDGGSDGGGSDGGPGDGADGGATTGCTCGTLAVEVTPGPGSRRLTSARNGPFLSQLVVHGVRSRPPDRRRDATRRTPRSVGFDG